MTLPLSPSLSLDRIPGSALAAGLFFLKKVRVLDSQKHAQIDLSFRRHCHPYGPKCLPLTLHDQLEVNTWKRSAKRLSLCPLMRQSYWYVFVYISLQCRAHHFQFSQSLIHVVNIPALTLSLLLPCDIGIGGSLAAGLFIHLKGV